MTPEQFRTAREQIGYARGLGRKLTQKELAKLLKMGKHGWQNISKWESDKFEGVIPGPVQVALESLTRGKHD